MDSAVHDGAAHVVHIAHEHLDFAPDFEETGHLVVAEVRFVHPETEEYCRALGRTRAAAVPGIAHVTALAAPGTRGVLLPPRQALPRTAALDAAESAVDRSLAGAASG